MSSALPGLSQKPLIAIVDRLNRLLQLEMVSSGQADGFPELKQSHNAVFGFLSSSGSHAADMAARAGVTRQSMGEVVRDLVALGIVEMTTDPADRRAKLVTYTDYGLRVARSGRQHILDVEQRLAEEFGAAEYEGLRDALERIAVLLEAPE